VSGSGWDIDMHSDQFQYIYQTLTYDGQITARVLSIQGTHEWAKAGVMIRQSDADGSRHASVFVTHANGVAYQRRTVTDGTSYHTAGSLVAAPYWVRIKRLGTNFTAFQSIDGQNWVQIGQETINMPGTLLIGLAVTSHDNSVLSTAHFDNVSIERW
jgi:regulation of enolase protein 1 (concanavalin A-like superfamily)